jgi:osmotically-inducible protein OsmY
VVTLLGCVPSRREVWAAEQAVYSTPGVLGIANELQVEDQQQSTDSVIAEAAVQALASYRTVAADPLKVIVSGGYITLCGVVADASQRGAAERAVRRLRGVRGVWNALKIVRAAGRIE